MCHLLSRHRVDQLTSYRSSITSQHLQKIHYLKEKRLTLVVSRNSERNSLPFRMDELAALAHEDEHRFHGLLNLLSASFAFVVGVCAAVAATKLSRHQVGWDRPWRAAQPLDPVQAHLDDEGRDPGALGIGGGGDATEKQPCSLVQDLAEEDDYDSDSDSDMGIVL